MSSTESTEGKTKGAFITREEWETDKKIQAARHAAETIQQCQDREILQEIRGDLKEVVAWKNVTVGQEVERKKTIKEFKAVKEWVDGMKRTAMNVGKVAAYMVGLATFWKFVVIPLFFSSKGGG